jgi:DNA-binding response OmpR family regulator
MSVTPLTGKSILVVEDEALVALDLAQALESAGAYVTTTSTLHHAKLLVTHDGLAAAVVDRALPDGDADEICRHLEKRGVPFVVYSGFETGAVQEGEKAVYISKPNSPELVVAAIQNLLASGAASADSP